MGSGLFLLILSQNGIQQILLLHRLLSEDIERWLCSLKNVSDALGNNRALCKYASDVVGGRHAGCKCISDAVGDNRALCKCVSDVVGGIHAGCKTSPTWSATHFLAILLSPTASETHINAKGYRRPGRKRIRLMFESRRPGRRIFCRLQGFRRPGRRRLFL